MFKFTLNESTANRRRIFFYAVDATDGYTPVTTGLSTSTSVYIVKNGVTPGTTPVSPSFTHIDAGLWYYEMTAANLDTVGVLTVRISDSLIRTVHLVGYVYNGDPLAAIPTFPTNFSSLAIDVSGQVTVGNYASGQAPLKPTVAGRTLDVTATGEAGIDWGNIGSPTTTVNFTGTTISTSQSIASVSGSVNSVATRVTANTDQWNGTGVTGMPMPTYTQPTGFLSASFPAGTIANTTNITAGTITTVSGNVNGSVGSVTGNVGGNVTGSVGSLTATAVQNIWDDLTSNNTVTGSVGKLIVDNLNATVSSRSTLTDTQVWSSATRTLTSGANIALAKGTGITGFNDITAQSVWDVLASAVSVTGSMGLQLKTNVDAQISTRLASSSYTAPLTTTGTAQAVWNAAYASYTTAGTFGKLMDVLRKANFVIEGTTTAGSTTTSINTNLTGYVTNAFDNQTILFISGALAGSAGLISGSTSGGGTFTLAETLPGTPASGVDFVVLGTHVHTKQGIADTTWLTDISGVSIAGQAGRYVTDGAIAASNASASASVIEGVAYREDIADILLGRNIAGGSNTGRLVKEALYALRNKSEIVGNTLKVYAEDDTTEAWTAAVSSSATANPVTGIDPA